MSGGAREQEYLDMLVSHAEGTVRFLSSELKPERERAVSAAFLRCVGVTFSAKEIASSKEQPPDVVFRSARFEVREVLDENRRRHDEWKAELERRKRAKSINALVERYKPPIPMDYTELVSVVAKALVGKSQKYGQTCSGLDALVYVNLKARFLDRASGWPKSYELAELVAQGWRSVSVLVPLDATVLYAQPSAPHFLRALVGQPKSEWPTTDGLFEM